MRERGRVHCEYDSAGQLPICCRRFSWKICAYIACDAWWLIYTLSVEQCPLVILAGKIAYFSKFFKHITFGIYQQPWIWASLIIVLSPMTNNGNIVWMASEISQFFALWNWEQLNMVYTGKAHWFPFRGIGNNFRTKLVESSLPWHQQNLWKEMLRVSEMASCCRLSLPAQDVF